MRSVMTRIAIALAVVAGSAGVAAADQVLIISSGIAANDAAADAALTAAGHSVTVTSQPIYDFNGSMNNLANYNAVVILQNGGPDGFAIPAAGQTALLNYIDGGGGLVTGEWSVWTNGARGNNTILEPALPVTPTGTYDYNSPITYTVSTPNGTLDAGLPSSFTFPGYNDGGTETLFQPKAGATAYFSSSDVSGQASDGLIGWSYGSGKVISFSTLIGPTNLTNADYSTLFSNAVNWAEGISVVVPEPSSIVLMGAGILGVVSLARWARRRVAG